LSRRRASTMIAACTLAFATAFPGAALAFDQHTSVRIPSNDANFAPVNGFHNWRQAKAQNWGNTNGNGGGYPAYLGLAMNDYGGQLGFRWSPYRYRVQRRGSGGGQFDWNFGTEFAGYWPIRETVSQKNPEDVSNWVWAGSNRLAKGGESIQKICRRWRRDRRLRRSAGVFCDQSTERTHPRSRDSESLDRFWTTSFHDAS